MATHVLTIPGWHPPLANAWRGRHWSVAHRLRTRMTTQFYVVAFVNGVPRAAGPRRVRLHLTGWAHGGNYPDRDAFDKLTLDSLVACGLLLGDDSRSLVGRVEVTYQRGPKATTVTLEDVPEG